MTTDLDRLHMVVLKPPTGRRTGKTYAKIHALASYVELESLKECIIIITVYSDVHYILAMMRDIFGERGLPPLRPTLKNKFLCGNFIFNFVTHDDYERGTRGKDNFFEISIGPDD